VSLTSTQLVSNVIVIFFYESAIYQYTFYCETYFFSYTCTLYIAKDKKNLFQHITFFGSKLVYFSDSYKNNFNENIILRLWMI